MCPYSLGYKLSGDDGLGTATVSYQTTCLILNTDCEYKYEYRYQYSDGYPLTKVTGHPKHIGTELRYHGWQLVVLLVDNEHLNAT